jgi:hypothetical protein
MGHAQTKHALSVGAKEAEAREEIPHDGPGSLKDGLPKLAAAFPLSGSGVRVWPSLSDPGGDVMNFLTSFGPTYGAMGGALDAVLFITSRAGAAPARSRTACRSWRRLSL